MIIEKIQKNSSACTFNWAYFDSARTGLKHLFRRKDLRGKTVLLPAYIGYSTREGSGVFDPVQAAKMPYEFYRLTKRLFIDLEDVKKKIRKSRGQILFLIHYFGFRDPNLHAVKVYAQKYGLTVIEDFAHAFFTFWQNPAVTFDYGVFSIHKLFPERDGGMVLSRNRLRGDGTRRYDLFKYDMPAIAARRIENYSRMLKRLRSCAKKYGITILRPSLHGSVPQTLPILVKSVELRDHLYFTLNRDGYGVVSLYHSLIDPIDSSYGAEQEVAGRILNLPVHQDVSHKHLDPMLDRMLEIISRQRTS